VELHVCILQVLNSINYFRLSSSVAVIEQWMIQDINNYVSLVAASTTLLQLTCVSQISC